MTKGGRATRPPLQQHRINVGDSPTLLCRNTGLIWATHTPLPQHSTNVGESPTLRVAHTPIALSRVALNCRSCRAAQRQPRLAFDSDSVSKQMFKTNDPTHHADHHRPAQSRQDTQRNCQGRRMQPSRTSCRIASAGTHSPPTALTLTATLTFSLTSVDASQTPSIPHSPRLS